MDIPSGKLTGCYCKLPCIVDFRIKDTGDHPRLAGLGLKKQGVHPVKMGVATRRGILVILASQEKRILATKTCFFAGKHFDL